MADKIKLQEYENVFDFCLKNYSNADVSDPLTLMSSIMDLPDFPMHYPVHHYLTAAVLLTVCRKKQGHDQDIILRDLKTAMDRAVQVPGGTCGFFGCCGAAVGVGIFWSVITDSSPLSGKSWSYGNKATGKALLAMAEQGGPRCCKRCSYTAVLSTLEQIKEVLAIECNSAFPVCRYYDNNKECIKAHCNFYPHHDGEN